MTISTYDELTLSIPVDSSRAECYMHANGWESVAAQGTLYLAALWYFQSAGSSSSVNPHGPAARLLAAANATKAAETARGTASLRRRSADGPKVASEFCGVFDLKRLTARGSEKRVGALRRHLPSGGELWWEPRGSAQEFGGRWVSFFDTMPLPDAPLPRQHPLFVLAALPRWLRDEDRVQTADDEFSVMLNVGAALSPGGAKVARFQSITVVVRLDEEGRFKLMSHAFSHRTGACLNRWRTTRLSEFGCGAPTPPDLNADPAVR